MRDGEEKDDDVDVEGETSTERLRLRAIWMIAIMIRANRRIDVGG